MVFIARDCTIFQHEFVLHIKAVWMHRKASRLESFAAIYAIFAHQLLQSAFVSSFMYF